MKAGVLDLDELDKNYLVIVQLAHQRDGVLLQVTLRPDKVNPEGLIRLGETPGDEANGWQYPDNINVISILGEAVEETPGQWKCRHA